MAQIQIYKPGFTTLFKTRDDSTTFINPEVVNLVHILRRAGHQVEMMSFSDELQHPIREPTHRILVSGRLYKKGDELDARVERELGEVKKLFDNSLPQYRVAMDWKMDTKNRDVLDGIDFELLTQTPKIPHYVEYEKVFLFGTIPIIGGKRKPSIIYVGNKRGGVRDSNVREFLLSNDVDYSLYGNWDTSKSKGRLLYRDSQRTIAQHKYGLCLTEDLYIQKQHRTPRVFEYFLAGTLALAESDYPVEEGLLNAWQFVEDGKELKDRIRFFEEHSKMYESLLERQRSMLLPEYFTGEYQYSKLKEAMKL